MNIDPEVPLWPERDRLVVSNGQIAPLLYAAYRQRGYETNDEGKKLHALDSPLQGRPCKLRAPYLDASSGSLGQGLSLANGLAMSAKMEGHPSQIFVLMGDGELQEGQVWEAAMSTVQHQLTNVCVIVDWNGSQRDGTVIEVKNVEPLVDKWRAFGWDAVGVNGHSVGDLMRAFGIARTMKEKPTILLAKTVKGKGVFSLEHVLGYDGSVLSQEQADKAVEDMAPLSD